MRIMSNVVVAVALAALLVGCGKKEEDAVPPSVQAEAPAAPAAQQSGPDVSGQPVQVVAVAGIDFPLALKERSREERPADGGGRSMVVRFDSEGDAPKVGAVVKESLSKAGYRVSEFSEKDGSTKYVGRTDAHRIAVVVYPMNAETGKGMVSFFWQE